MRSVPFPWDCPSQVWDKGVSGYRSIPSLMVTSLLHPGKEEESK